MDDSVHDGIRNDTTAEAGKPFARFVLRTKDGRPLIVTSFEDLQEIFVLLFRRDIEEPFIYDEEVIVRKFRDSTGYAVASFHCQVQRLEHFWHTEISCPVQMPTGFLPNCTSQMSLSGTRKTVYDEVGTAGNKATRAKTQYDVPVQVASFIVHRIDTSALGYRSFAQRSSLLARSLFFAV